jgi:hypothetical protein
MQFRIRSLAIPARRNAAMPNSRARRHQAVPVRPHPIFVAFYRLDAGGKLVSERVVMNLGTLAHAPGWKPQ